MNMRNIMNLLVESQTLPARPSTDDPSDVARSCFVYGRDIGNKIFPITKLKGGVNLADPQQRKRIETLVQLMSSPDGYISRLIVDTDGNVLEGQHRLEALRQMNVSKVPVRVAEDMARNIDVDALNAAINCVQKMHVDQRKQIIEMVLEAFRDEGSVRLVRDDYEPPRGYERAWNAVLDALEVLSPSSEE